MKKSEQETVLDDKWIILELIGKGAIGEVYRAHQTNLKRDVANKVISEAVIAEIEDDPEELDIAFGRFQREVQTMARVRHANILAIYDYGEIVNGDNHERLRTAYIAMDYIPGDSLRFHYLMMVGMTFLKSMGSGSESISCRFLMVMFPRLVISVLLDPSR